MTLIGRIVSTELRLLDNHFAHPEDYEHVSGTKEKRLDLMFRGTDVEIYNSIQSLAENEAISIQEAFLKILKENNK